MEGVREFLQSSTIHGLAYINSERRQVRFFWLIVVIAGFTGAGIMINQSFSSWANSPISTTIETLPIREIDFPNVTVCPPRNSFTSLNPDLVSARNITFDEEKRKELLDYVPYATYDVTYNANDREYEEFLEGQRKYRGISKLELTKNMFSTKKQYDFFTTSPIGSFSTPYFGEPYNVSLIDCELVTWVHIYVPENLTVGSKIIVDLDYDVNDDDDFDIYLAGKKTRNSTSYSRITKIVYLDKTKKKSSEKFSVAKNSSEAMLVLLHLLIDKVGFNGQIGACEDM